MERGAKSESSFLLESLTGVLQVFLDEFTGKAEKVPSVYLGDERPNSYVRVSAQPGFSL